MFGLLEWEENGSGKWGGKGRKLGFVHFPFLVFGCNCGRVSEKVYCVFRCLLSNVEVKVKKLTTKLTVK